MIFLKRKSWSLKDASLLAKEYPYTFYQPSNDCVQLLEAGNKCKLIFKFKSDDPEAPGAERMWVNITKIKNTSFEGVLDNDPLHIKDLKHGDKIKFSARHIIDTDVEDPVPSIVDKYIHRCFVTSRVLHEGEKVHYLYREEGMGTFKDDIIDSGWRLFSGIAEDDDYVNNPDNVHCVSLGAVLSKDDRFIHLLDKPVGSAFEWDYAASCFAPVLDE